MDSIPAWIDGVLTPVDKLEAHRRGLRHKAVSVFVLRGDKVLLQRRALGKYHTPGLWANTCCTHPHWDESGLDCARRRLDAPVDLPVALRLRRGGRLRDPDTPTHPRDRTIDAVRMEAGGAAVISRV